MVPLLRRQYRIKDVDMLIVASTISDAAIAHKSILQANRSTWADPFFDDLKNDIDTAIQTHLGVDATKDLRLATIAINQLQTTAIYDLALLKVQISEDFKDNPIRKVEILNELGFTTFLKSAQRKDQEALINLLFQFKTNLSPSLRNEIVTKGTADTLLTKIINYADNLKSADIIQEGTKGTKKVITFEAITDFNAIYNRVISVAKIASKIFKESPAIQQQFTFKRVARNINAYKSNTNPHTPPTP